MSETIKSPETFAVTEIADEKNRRTRLINGNSAAAEALEHDEFWRLIVGKSRIKAWEPSIAEDLQEFFGTEDAPDELVVVSPLHDTSAVTPIRTMWASCWESPHIIRSGANMYLPAFFWGDNDCDALIRVEQADCYTNIPHYDDPTNCSSTVFRASLARLPKGFLYNYKEFLSQVESETMLANSVQGLSINPLDLVSQTGLAKLLNVSKQRVSQLKAAGALPEPTGLLDESIPVWSREVADQFSAERNRILGKISLHE